jgi:hypothetical protein
VCVYVNVENKVWMRRRCMSGDCKVSMLAANNTDATKFRRDGCRSGAPTGTPGVILLSLSDIGDTSPRSSTIAHSDREGAPTNTRLAK